MKITIDRSLVEQALEALEADNSKLWPSDRRTAAYFNLRAALAKPPVDDPHRDHWVAIAEAAQKIAASTERGLAEAKALCAALDRLTDAALAEPVQEPVAWMYHYIRHDGTPHDLPCLIWRPEYMDAMSAKKGAKAIPLYAAPPQRKPLTEEEILRIKGQFRGTLDVQFVNFTREIERAHEIGE